MERWIPLFDIFLNSSCPETEATMWLQKNFNPSSNSATNPISTASFLSFLINHTQTPDGKRVAWIQTLPNLVQARVLSFLVYDHQRFCKRDLCRLARVMLSERNSLDFWVKKAAQRLMDLVSVSDYGWISHLNLDSEEEEEKDVEDEFCALPDWLKEAATGIEPMFPWLPMLGDELSPELSMSGLGKEESGTSLDLKKSEGKENEDEIMRDLEVNEDESNSEEPVDAEVEESAKSLRSRIVNMESKSKALQLAKEIKKLCNGSSRNRLAILNMIEPCHSDDESASFLISAFSDIIEGHESDWPSHVLCSIVLPKFLSLNEPSSRVLLNATIEFCKAHQRAAEYGLLLPLFLANKGVNMFMCDAIAKIVKECLHPSHVSAICEKLLSKDRDSKRLVCLQCHKYLIGDELVWTESLFGLWQNMLNLDVCLSRDSVERIVARVCEFAEIYSKSLKFGNFVLCFVNRFASSLKPHKSALMEAVKSTDTLVTKSTLMKLSGL